MICGLAFGRVANHFGLPLIVGYVLTGVLFSPDLLGKHIELNSWSDALTQAALGIIAYLIGGSMTIEQIKRLGRIILSVAVFESLGAALLVFAAVLLLVPAIAGVDELTLALIFAAVSVSTAPASTVAVLHQYNARGPVSTSLLGVVAVDDAIGIIVFSVIMVMLGSDVLSQSLGQAFIYILFALLWGGVMGGILTWLGRYLHTDQMRIILIIGTIFVVIGAAEFFHISVLLSAMALGFSSRYFVKSGGAELFRPVENIEEMVFVVFFTLAGAHFEIDVFTEYLPLILIYLTARAIGKVAGAALGAKLAGAPPVMVRWLGMGLLPQAGVAIGLSLTIAQIPMFSEVGVIVVNVILATTIIYELLGPLVVRFALSRTGELGEPRERSSS